MAKRRKARSTGIRKFRNGWQAYVQVGERTVTRTYPIDTDLAIMKQWREDIKKDAAATRTRAPSHGTLLADIEGYLQSRTTMPSYRCRKRHLAWWTDRLGHDRHRDSITTQEVDTHLRELYTTKAAQTVRLHRTALRSFYEAINGKGGQNPVRASWTPPATDSRPRPVNYDAVARALATMQRSKAWARMQFMYRTGWPPAVVMRVQPDVDLMAQTVNGAVTWFGRARPRRKGAGTPDQWIPLSSHAKAAWDDMTELQAWGRYSTSQVRRDFLKAATRAGITGIRPYDVRHAFGVNVYRLTRDIRTTQRLLLHADTKTTEIYVKAIESDVDITTAQLLSDQQPQ